MTRRDPSLIELYELTKSDDQLNTFLRDHGLISKPPIIGYTRNQTPFIGYCAAKPFNILKPQCTGVITEITKNGLPKYRCTVCKSEKSAHHGPSAYDPQAVQSISFFNSVDSAMRPNRKISPKEVLYITFAIAKELPPSRLEDLTGSKLSSATVIEWSNYLRTIAPQELSRQPEMGGVGDVVEIDECYMKGRRKSNRGRLLAGNLAGHRGHRVNNYLARSQGPWLFGIICRRTKECRMFWVPDRKASTLIPLIRSQVAQGTTIISDEWRAYRCLPQYGYRHYSVNHSANFVSPINGTSTQMIERQWRKAKLPLLKQGPGVSMTTIRSHLAKFWWLSLNGRHVCNDPFLRMVDLIAKHFNF